MVNGSASELHTVGVKGDPSPDHHPEALAATPVVESHRPLGHIGLIFEMKKAQSLRFIDPPSHRRLQSHLSAERFRSIDQCHAHLCHEIALWQPTKRHDLR